MEIGGGTRRARVLAPAALALVLLALAAALSQFDGVEHAILERCRGLGTAWLTGIMLAITELASTLVVVGLALTWMLAHLRWARRLAFLPALAAAGAGLTSVLVKTLVHRSRPDVVEALVQVDSFSFPSGHALLAMAFYGTLALCLAPRVRHRLVRIGLAAFAGMLVLLIGASRVYLGVHYPSDVLAGFALGAVWLWAMWPISRACQRGRAQRVFRRSQMGGLP